MILTCPSCSTRYLTDAAKFARGRTVRCGTCGHSWYQAPPRDATRQLSAPEAYGSRSMGATTGGGLGPAMDLSAPAPRRKTPSMSGGAAVIAGWAVLGIFLAGIAGGLILFKDQVIAAWPKAATAYNRLAGGASATGLDIRNLDYARAADANGAPVIRVRGEVVNVSQAAQQVPAVRVELQDGDRRQVSSLTIDLPTKYLQPLASSTFSAELTELPPGLLSGTGDLTVAVRFGDAVLAAPLVAEEESAPAQQAGEAGETG